MGLFDIFKKNKKIINNNRNNIKKEINSFNGWLDNILKDNINDDVIALNFNIYEDSDNKYRLELIGSSNYDKDNDDWACEEIFSTRDNTYTLNKEDLNEQSNIESAVINLVRNYMYIGTYKDKLENLHAICCGFVDGELEIIYSNEKYRKIVDYKSISVNSFEEVLDFIKNNNVMWSKRIMQKNLDIKLNGYAKKAFDKEYEILLEKNIISNYNGMAYEGSTMAPGAIISKFGYIVINITGGGNAICMDLNSSLDNPRIIFADHSIFCDIDPYISNEVVWTKELIDENINVVRNTFEEYVNDVKNGKLDIEDLDLEF